MKIRVIDLITWVGMGVIAWLLIMVAVGCGSMYKVERALQVAESAQAAAGEAAAVVEEVQDAEDWFGTTEIILTGLGSVLAAFGGRAGYKKLKGTGNGKKVEG